jgi:hypothetical protein
MPFLKEITSDLIDAGKLNDGCSLFFRVKNWG